jgi:phage I-like protein
MAEYAGKWNDITRTGEWHQLRPDGTVKEVVITLEHLQQVVANVDAVEWEIPVDYNHGLENPSATPEQKKSAGRIEASASNFRIVPHPSGDGSHVLQGKVKWTDQAKAYIDAEEYSGMSIVMDYDYPNPYTGEMQGATMHSIGLTNQAFIPGLQPVQAGKEKGSEQGRIAMDEAKIRELLKLDDEADIGEAITLLLEKSQTSDASAEELEALKPLSDVIASRFGGKVETAVDAMNTVLDRDKVVMSRTELADMNRRIDKGEDAQARINTMEKNAAIEPLILDQRIDPKDRGTMEELFDDDRDRFERIVAMLPVAKRSTERKSSGKDGATDKERIMAEINKRAQALMESNPRFKDKPARAKLSVLNSDPALKAEHDTHCLVKQ